MTKEEKSRWVLETLAEGGYSFREIADYVGQHGLSPSDLSDLLQPMLLKGLLFVQRKEKDGEQVQLSQEAAMEALRSLGPLVDQETLTRAVHFIDVSEQGRRVTDRGY